MPVAAPAKPAPDDSGVTNDVMADVMKRLDLPADMQATFLPKALPAKPAAGTTGAKPGNEEEPGAEAVTEDERVAALAEERGVTVEEIQAEEAEAEQERLEGLSAETGKSIEDIQAEEAESKRLETTAAERGITVEELQAEEAAGGATGAADAKELETIKAELATKESRIGELEGELTTLKTKPLKIEAQGLHPVLYADSEQDITRTDAELAKFEEWALANWDGTEAVEAKGNQPAIPAYSAHQVRQRYAQVQEQRKQLIPAAREILKTRRQADVEAKAAYPELFDPKKPEYALARQMLAQAPGLKALFPNIMIIIGDAMRGEKARAAEAKKKTAGTKPGLPARPAPRVPVRVAPAGGKPVGGAKPKPGRSAAGVTGVNVGGFIEGGSTRDSLVNVLKKANF